MTATTRIRAAAFALAALVVSSPAFAQIDAGPLVNWADMTTWTQYNEGTRQTEMGLGLIPSGMGGTMRVSFEASLAGRRPTKAPTRVMMRLIPPPFLNPNTVRSSTARFEIDENKENRVVIDASDRVVSLDPQVGAYSTSVSVAMTIEEFERLASAETIKADLLGFAVEFSPAQIKALKAFADKVMLRTR
ncbi:MAG: hypothetical protein R2752_08320 [Vicinamibacterales bacterium]